MLTGKYAAAVAITYVAGTVAMIYLYKKVMDKIF